MRVSGSDLRLLQVFDAVVRNGGFAAAEPELNVGSSTISNHMAALEQRLGFTLCHRGRGGFRLTERGQAVWEASRQLDKALQDFSADVAAVRGELRGELRIGVLDAIWTDPANRLADVIAEFGRVAPQVRLVLGQERPQDMQQKVADGLYHCAIGSHRDRVEGIEYDALYEERHSLYCGRTHPEFGTPDDSLSDDVLAALPFVHRGYWREEDALRSVDWRIEATVYQIEPQMILIRSGRFIGLLPDHYARAAVAAGELRAIRPDEIGYVCIFELFSLSGRRTSDITAAFVETVRRVWRSGTEAAAA